MNTTTVPPRPVRRFSLTAKQAVLTLIIAVLLSIVSSVLELALDVRHMRAEIREQTRHNLALINGSAAEAAFQLNPNLARQVIDGLFAAGSVQRVIIRDDFGREMVRRELSRDSRDGWLIQQLFGDILHYHAVLEYDLGEGTPAAPVGEIELALALDSLGQAFRVQSLRLFSLGVLKALAIAALVAAFFHLFITRPLLKIHTAIADTDPQQPGQWPKPRLKHHRHDELGELVEGLDRLLGAFQQGLEQRDRLQQISTLDGLTGIANRRRFDAFLDEAWVQARRHDQALAVIFIDLDHFKEFNDHFGHLTGDDTLRAVARALTEVVTRPGDLVARYGGEEFVCVLTDTDLHGASKVADRIKQAILALEIAHVGHVTHDHVTASLGVASTRPASGEMSRDELMELADRQLYCAKHGGRNQVAWQA